jgi:phosphoribosylglycinamide formyltransferase 1
VISNNPTAPVLAGARELGVPAIHLSRRTHPDPTALDDAIITTLQTREVDLVLLAGYFRPLGEDVLRAFPGRVLNLHP